MTDSLDFSGKNLRNRSFRRRDLSGANFTNADIRGCDFRQAYLVGANFAGVRAGCTPMQAIVPWGIAIAIALLSIQAVLDSGFGGVGKTPGDRGWSFVVALLVTLSLAGMGAGLKALASGRLGWVAGAISGIASGAFLGFYYAGIATDKNPQIAVVGAVLGGVLMVPATGKFGNRVWLQLVVAVAGAIFGYGFALLMGVRALAYANVGEVVNTTIFGLACLLYLGFTLESGAFALRLLTTSPGTSFAKADLTDARFDGAKLDRTDFSQAKGTLNRHGDAVTR